MVRELEFSELQIVWTEADHAPNAPFWQRSWLPLQPGYHVGCAKTLHYGTKQGAELKTRPPQLDRPRHRPTICRQVCPCSRSTACLRMTAPPDLCVRGGRLQQRRRMSYSIKALTFRGSSRRSTERRAAAKLASRGSGRLAPLQTHLLRNLRLSRNTLGGGLHGATTSVLGHAANSQAVRIRPPWHPCLEELSLGPTDTAIR